MSERVRFMRLIVFFDLPTETSQQRREYTRFRKFLIKNGYLMMQKSVYVKLAVDGKIVSSLVAKLSDNRPPEGLVQCLQVTEKQYAGIINIVGGPVKGDELEDLQGLVIL